MNPHIFKRKIYVRMLSWKKSEQGASALLLQGARRVGKSTIAREFAKNEYESYICIDFSSASAQIFDLWNDISDLNYIFLTLQNSYNVSLTERNSVIIFDEIQLCPKARQAIKHLVADGRYDYIETGSLLSIKQNIKNIIIPSEETRISMYPLDFEEFLWATGKPMLFDQVRYAYNNLRPLGDALNRSMMKEFRLYMLVGGMPQAIVKYLDTNDFRAVDAAKRNILELYAEDFRKIDPKGQITELLRSIPAELGRNTLRYKIGSVIKNGTASRLGVQLANMADSLTVNFAYHADDPSVGFALHANRDFFKLFLTDTGLLVTLAFMDRDYTQNDIYHKLLTGHLAADLGYVYENAVAQMLKTAGHELYYYTFKENESDRRPYEVDFLISDKTKICPIEVKSSSYKVHKSLDAFRQKFQARTGHSYLIYTKDLRRDADILCLPVYMTGLL